MINSFLILTPVAFSVSGISGQLLISKTRFPNYLEATISRPPIKRLGEIEAEAFSANSK